MIRRLCVVGVGLIGGSLARALKAAGAVGEVVGSGRSAANLQRAVDLGVIDRFDTDPGRASVGADMVMVATPLGAVPAVFGAIRDHLAADAVVTDAGSVKGTVLDAAASAFGRVPPNLVPGHPVAGTEHSGVEASFATLFEGHRVILTPRDDTDPDAVDRVREMWRRTGAEVVEMDAGRHDRVLAATSHLPHLLAYCLVHLLGGTEERESMFEFAAGGFRDFTRIASSDPRMWHDICLENREAIVDMLEAFGAELGAARQAVARGDGPALEALFTRAKALRDRYVRESPG